MKIKTLGEIVSLIYCKQCGMSIEIYVNQEYTICPNCKKRISLKYEMT